MNALRGVALLAVGLAGSGCCCNPFSASTDDSDWSRAVARERDNRQSEALEPGTANVFSLEVSAPAGLTQQAQADDDEVTLHHEAVRLELQLAERQGAQSSALQALRDELAALDETPKRAAAEGLEVREQLEFVVLYPQVPMIEERGFSSDPTCAACLDAAARHRAIPLRSFGSPGLDLRTVDRASLEAGVRLTGAISVGSIEESNTASVHVPSQGKAVLKLVRSCPAKVVRVDDTLTVGTGSGVIAVPRREERSWHELREAGCVTSGRLRRVTRGEPLVSSPEKAPSYLRVLQARRQLELLGP